MSYPVGLEVGLRDTGLPCFCLPISQIADKILNMAGGGWWCKSTNQQEENKGEIIYLLQKVRQSCLPPGPVLYPLVKLEAPSLLD